MSRRRANRLFPQEIDEVSSVDSPANQHGLIAIAKRDGAAEMPKFYDGEGYVVDPEQVPAGQQIFAEDGTAYNVVDSDEVDELINSGELDPSAVVGLDDYDDEDSYDDDREPVLAGVGKRNGLGATHVRGRGAPAVSGGNHSAREVRRGRRRGELGEPVGKSLGDTVLETLRKSLDDADRDEVIATIAKSVDASNERSDRLETLLTQVLQDREGEYYTGLAKRFDAVPADTDTLAGILQKASATMSKRELDTLERVLEAAGEANLYSEIGYGGTSSGNTVHDEVQAVALELVGKSNGLTYEQAMTELYSANPDAYTAYEAEQG